MTNLTATVRRGRPVDEPARQAKLRHILASARACFARDGFHRAGTADICREAGISPANLYQYFANKDAIIVAIAEEYRIADMALLAEFSRAPSFVEGLSASSAQLEQSLEEDPHYPRLRLEILAEATRNPRVAEVVLRAEQEVRAALAAIIDAARARGEIATDLPAELLADIVLSVMDGASARQAVTGIRLDTATIDRVFLKLLLLADPPGLAPDAPAS